MLFLCHLNLRLQLCVVFQRQNAVTVYLKSKQLLHFGFTWQTVYMTNHKMFPQLICFNAKYACVNEYHVYDANV